MDILRISIAEAADAFLVGELPSGETVDMQVFYDLKGESSPILDDDTCTEYATSGLYYWSLSNIQTAPATDMIVLWRMRAVPSGRNTWGILYVGGYPNVIADQTSKMNFAGDHITADIRALADNVITSAKIAENAITDEKIASGAITAVKVANGTITADKIAASALDNKGNWNVGKTGYALTATTGLGNQTANITGNITGNLTGSVGSVTGSVGSVTGNVGGNVVGSVGIVAPDGIGAVSIEDNALTGDKFAATAVTKIVGSAVAIDGGAATIAGMLTKMADDNAGADFDATTDSLNKIASSTATPPTVEQIAAELERVGGMLEEAKDAAVSSQEEGEEINAKLEAGSLAPGLVQFEATT